MKFKEWMKEEEISEGMFGNMMRGMFGGGNQQQPEQPQAQPQQPQAKGFQLDPRANNAKAFADSIISQMSQVIGPAYEGRLRQTRGGMQKFHQMLQSFWGRGRNSIGGNAQTAQDLPNQVKQMADRVIWAQ